VTIWFQRVFLSSSPPLARLNIDLIRGNEVEPSKCVTCYD
jgi:hypothetical protein